MKPKITNVEIKRCFEIELKCLNDKQHAIIRTARRCKVSINTVNKAIK